MGTGTVGVALYLLGAFGIWWSRIYADLPPGIGIPVSLASGALCVVGIMVTHRTYLK